MYKVFIVFPKKGYKGYALIAAENEIEVMRIIKKRRSEDIMRENFFWGHSLDKEFYPLPDYVTSSEKGVILNNIYKENA